MRINWDIFNPSVSTRLWTVDLSDWNNGRFECFWLKSSAMKYVKAHIDMWLFVDVRNEWTGKNIRLKPLVPYRLKSDPMGNKIKRVQ